MNHELDTRQPGAYGPDSLSVILVSYNSRSTIGPVLEALERQSVRGFECLLIDSSDDGTADFVKERFPAVRVFHSAERLYPGKARNVGVRLTSRALIAFVDADCVAEHDWVERILAAHNERPESERWIVGGSVGVANPDCKPGWASFFCEFSPWLKRGANRSLPDVPTCCYSMKRVAFERFGPFQESGYCSDTAFNWKAGAGGHRPWFVPGIHVRHLNPGDWQRVLAKQGMHGETFARLRAARQGWSAAQLKLRALTAPALPAALWLRTALRVSQARGYRIPFLRATPLLFVVLAAWAKGEARGYWNAR